MSQLYILRAREPVEVASLDEWYDWFSTYGGQRIVARTVVGPSVVYTAFQGIDLREPGEGGPFAFETLVAGGELDGVRQSYSCWRDAECGHRVVVARVAAIRHTTSRLASPARTIGRSHLRTPARLAGSRA